MVLTGENVVLQDPQQKVRGRSLTFHVGDDTDPRRRSGAGPHRDDHPLDQGAALAVTLTSPARPPAPAAESTTLLAARGLTKSYGRRLVVQRVDLEIRTGEVVGLLGPNGAGKTTTFYMMVGLTRPDSGQVLPGRRGHHRAAHVPARARRHRLPAPGGERLPQADRRGERARDPGDAGAGRGGAARAGPPAAGRAGHPGHGEASPPIRSRAASGGAWRSAARWPPRRPSSCWTSRSPASTRWRVHEIQGIIGHLTERGIGILITDHNVRETLKITDRAYILREGEVFRSGTPSELASDEEVRRVYLGESFQLDERGP